MEVGNREDLDQAGYEYQEELGSVVEFLLTRLKDRDTVVRWSAAKGLGRVTSRLPQEMGDEVVSSLLSMFTIRETDAAWHGGCLALAELGRRGFLLPYRLPEVVPILVKALNYEEQQGRFSIGTHVRDSACYLCWSFARAYDPTDLAPYVEKLASVLLTVTVFDREVNCRRAASAAFQENVGRQCCFPHGIEILTVADYFEVGQRNYCYRDLSVFVAGFSEYTKTMIDHLVQMKLGHWDGEIRELAADALGRLTKIAPKYMVSEILPGLIGNCLGMELFLRQGSLFGIGQVVSTLLFLLNNFRKQKLKIFPLTEKITEEISNIPSQMESAQFLRGMGQDLMRIGLNFFIGKLSEAGFGLRGDFLKSWQKILDENLCHFEEGIREDPILKM